MAALSAANAARDGAAPLLHWSGRRILLPPDPASTPSQGQRAQDSASCRPGPPWYPLLVPTVVAYRFPSSSPWHSPFPVHSPRGPLRIVMLDQHAILVRTPRKCLIPRTRLGARFSVEREEEGWQCELPAEERVPCPGGRRRTARGGRKRLKPPASHFDAAKPQSANTAAR